MPQYLSTDPHAGLDGAAAKRYLSTDPNAGMDAPASPSSPVSPNEPGTWLGGFAKGLREQFAPREMARRASEGAIGVVQGATDLINPQTYMAIPGAIRTIAGLPGQIAEEGIGPTLDRAGQAAMEVANDPRAIGRIAGNVAAPGVGGGAIRTIGKVPAGRIAKTVGGGAAGAAANIPIVGPMGRGAIRGARKSWKASGKAAGGTDDTVRMAAPVDAEDTVRMAAPIDTEDTVSLIPGKRKLSAPEVAAELRKRYGSDKAGRMLYGKSRAGVKPADRKAAIKRLAPGESKLPDAAAETIGQELAGMTPEEAFAYASRAPNAQAQGFFGKQLRDAILSQLEQP